MFRTIKIANLSTFVGLGLGLALLFMLTKSPGKAAASIFAPSPRLAF